MDISLLVLNITSTIVLLGAFIGAFIAYILTYLIPILFLYWCIPTLWKKIDNWLWEFNEYRAKMIGKEPNFVTWDSDNFTEERKIKRAWAKKHPILHFLKEAYDWIASIFWYRVPDYPNDIKWHIKRFYQRGKRGWANSDTWGFSGFLSEVIRDGCKHLDKTKQGIPMSAFPEDAETDETGNHTDAAFDDACKRWDVILQKIIKTFDTAQNIGEHHWYYQKSSKYNQEEADRHIATNKKFLEEDPVLWEDEKLHVMTLEECKEYEEGWELFQEHFFGLWD